MLNNAVIMGRLVSDPELKYTSNNIQVTAFTVAVERRYARQGTERETDFIDIVAWRQTAEFITKYFSKGDMIAIQGAIQTRTYTDKNDNKRKAVEIIAENVSFCGSRKTDSSNTSQGSTAKNQPQSYSNIDIGDFEEIIDDEDLPF